MTIETLLDEIGRAMADGPIDEVALQPVLEAAARLEVVPVAVAVLADVDAPYVARCRAFDRVSRALRAAREPRQRFVVAA